jgi:ABC-2 type transport system ATP-binding protein
MPTAGSLRVFGIDVLRQPRRAKELMGIVPQESGTFGALRTEEHLRIFGQLRGLTRSHARQRTEELLSVLGLLEHRRKLAGELSGGLTRKLLMGTAVMAWPRMLVLDEPTTGLDPNSRREVWGLIRSLCGDGGTVLLTTHYMDEAETLCNRVAIMGAGRILAGGTVDEIRAMCSQQFKVTYELDGAQQTLYGQTHQEVLGRVERMGLQEYALSKTSLEDLYLELTSHG